MYQLIINVITTISSYYIKTSNNELSCEAAGTNDINYCNTG